MDGGTGNSREGGGQWDGKQSGREQDALRREMVGGGNRVQRREGSGNRGRELNITLFPVPVPSNPSRPLFPVAIFTAHVPANYLDI